MRILGETGAGSSARPRPAWPTGHNHPQRVAEEGRRHGGTDPAKETVSDRTIERFLAGFLPKCPGVRKVSVSVNDGVVNLVGQVDDDDSRDEITDVVKRVEGVRVVMNQMSTDEEVMTGWELATGEFTGLASYLGRKWLLIILAIVMVRLAVGIARLFLAHSETVLAPLSAIRCCDGRCR